MQRRITFEAESREVSHLSFKRRLDCVDETLEGNLQDAAKKASIELELAIEGLRRDLAGSLADIHSSFNQFTAQPSPRSEIAGQSGIEVTINGHLAELANGVKVDVDRLGQEIEAVGKRVQGEREEREADNAHLRDRIHQLSSSLSEFKEHASNVDATAMSIALQPKHDSTGGSAAEPQLLGDPLALSWPSTAASDATLPGNSCDMDCTVWKHLMNERSARLHYEQTVKDSLAHETQARELLASSLEEVRSSHAARLSELQELVRHHKETLEDQLVQEKVDRTCQHGAVIARVDSLQRTLGMFDATTRKEVAERSEDSQRNAVECRHATPNGLIEQQSMLDCLQSQARPLTKRTSVPGRGGGLSPSGPRPPATGSTQVNVSYGVSPRRAASPPACGVGAGAQVRKVAPPAGSQSPVLVSRSASGTIPPPRSASNIGRMSGSIVMSTRLQ
jgi:hypothetical protein